MRAELVGVALILGSVAVADRLGELKESLQSLDTNYGFLGPRVVQLYLSKPPAYWRGVVMGRIAQWDRTVAMSASDRFRSATAALIEVGASIGAAMGLDFDVPAIKAVVESQWRRQLHEFEAERRKPVDFVKSYLDDFMGEFLVVGGVSGDALMANAPRRYRGEIRGRAVDGKFRAETVMIPDADRRTACVSSQVGCPVGCRFCASGINGVKGNLTAAQIVEQVFRLNEMLAPRQERITNDLDRASALREESAGVMEGYEKALTDARAHAQSVMAATTADIAADQPTEVELQLETVTPGTLQLVVEAEPDPVPEPETEATVTAISPGAGR